MTSKLFQDLVSAGRVLLEGTFVQYLLVIGVCILLYYVTLSGFWLLIGLFYAVVIMARAVRYNRRTGGHRGTSNGPAGGPVDFGGGSNGDGNGGSNGG
jgi:uncharacterized membrane protein YgcG